jgi:hypothetical protein
MMCILHDSAFVQALLLHKQMPDRQWRQLHVAANFSTRILTNMAIAWVGT